MNQGILRKAAALGVAAAVALGAWASPAEAYASATQTMWRLYNPNTGEHFYTANTYERDHLASVGWRREGEGWTAPVKSSTPVYRLYNPVIAGGDHHYTVNSNERDMLVRVGWRYEGVGWYSDDARGVALQRLYNPNAATGTHHYTVDTNERDHLASVGWRYEGVAWYGAAASPGGSPGGGGSAQGPGGPSSDSGSSGGGETRPDEARYSYSAYYIDGLGDDWYPGVPRMLYIRTDNPDASFRLAPSSGAGMGCGIPTGYIDLEGEPAENSTLRVEGGYVAQVQVTPGKVGGCEIRILEEGGGGEVEASAIPVSFKDYDGAVDAWIDGYIARCTDPSMNPVEKMEAVSRAMLEDFTYLPNDGSSYLSIATMPSRPYFLTYRWESYTSPEVLCRVAERIGGFSEIHNCYYDAPEGSEEWARTHWFCRCTYQGEQYFFEACPMMETGKVDPASVSKIDFGNLGSPVFDPVG